MTFNAENPCNAAKKIRANPESNEARCSKTAFPSAGDTYVEFPFALGELPRREIGRKALYTFRSKG